MVDTTKIAEHMEVVDSDGVHVGTVDHLDGDRIKLTKQDSPQTEDGQGAKHHYISIGLVAGVDDGKVWLSANADNVTSLEETE
ncbi:DUF2171 domain-containing protein [Sphingomonas bacterium]|uniref:DUF2171 domain-containing protein n=1 Tax=Sphingomonas bacterium TaxID=1895847 RepID=UPI0015752E24|nr:DUF2171 domain-containing protein [Sphingomonas bacterium]